MAEALKNTSELPDCLSGSFHIESDLELTFGDTLSSTIIEYTLYGDVNKPAIVVLGGISANQYVANTYVEGHLVNGWWDPLVGVGKAIDLNRYCVVSINYLDGQSSNRTNANGPLKISTFDQATILNYLLAELGLSEYFAIIGSSYGGMVALAFAEKYPTKLKQLITVCCTEKSSSRNTALRSLQRQILEFSSKHDDIKTGLILARSLATLGYRGSNEIETRFENDICTESKSFDFPVTSYLQNQGEKFADRFCSERFTNLSLSVDLHHVTPTNIKAPCLCVGIEGDLIAPVDDVKQLVSRIGENAKYEHINSNVGHDGFLKEFSQLTNLIQSNLGN